MAIQASSPPFASTSGFSSVGGRLGRAGARMGRPLSVGFFVLSLLAFRPWSEGAKGAPAQSKGFFGSVVGNGQVPEKFFVARERYGATVNRLTANGGSGAAFSVHVDNNKFRRAVWMDVARQSERVASCGRVPVMFFQGDRRAGVVVRHYHCEVTLGKAVSEPREETSHVIFTVRRVIHGHTPTDHPVWLFGGQVHRYQAGCQVFVGCARPVHVVGF